MSKGNQVKEMKGEDCQIRQPLSGGSVKPMTSIEDRQSWVPKSPPVFPVVIHHMPANGENPQSYDEIRWHPFRNDKPKTF